MFETEEQEGLVFHCQDDPKDPPESGVTTTPAQPPVPPEPPAKGGPEPM